MKVFKESTAFDSDWGFGNAGRRIGAVLLQGGSFSKGFKPFVKNSLNTSYRVYPFHVALVR